MECFPQRLIARSWFAGSSQANRYLEAIALGSERYKAEGLAEKKEHCVFIRFQAYWFDSRRN